ncbi:MAG: RNA polymerase sigma factor [Candidatus Heteroscillospira sp.]|jgi:RNA polymerase sigma-70 factor (ECF subfamily)
MQKMLMELFSTYYKDVYGYLYSLSHDAPLSEELASAVFLEVVRSIATFRGESDIKTWLFTIARRQWFSHLRRKSKAPPTAPLAEAADLTEQTMEEKLQDKMLARRIYELLDSEPERTRNIVLMRTEGYSYYEIGRRWGVSESSARVICFRAKEKIRKILNEEGFGNE